MTSSRPYTTFTLLNRSQAEPATEAVVSSTVLNIIADCMRFDKGSLNKSKLLDSNLGKKETRSKLLVDRILTLFNDEDILRIIGNSEVEKLLVELAEICTQHLKVSNEGIKNNVLDCLKRLEE
ncbi:hypothetical protein HPULCUR_007272 [Helicostylum pulchrum]|uniref:Uncharacterized protein n=1 Tax=Helicostylum pulchrum TaxID=562976 RepID=A0ABP9Y5G6_9FUNG